ncbi:PPA1309 family protein [Georgenia sp. AZ-5]|uniref:PPA1309 family protein n=1 Tax=Georgenia sp. AZ-5 TaxID=3367526 RepID=UPI0037552521
MTEQPAAPMTAREGALRSAVLDLERHVASLGWDGPVFVFALVRTADALAQNPGLARELPAEAVRAAEEDAEHLTSIEQDGLPGAGTLEELLGQLAWPDAVDGAAIVVERMVVPPEAEQGMPADPQAAVEYLMNHPAREDVRMAAGVLRTGESWCALRARSHDSDDAVGGSPEAVPGLVAALRSTFA